MTLFSAVFSVRKLRAEAMEAALGVSEGSQCLIMTPFSETWVWEALKVVQASKVLAVVEGRCLASPGR